MCLIDWLISPCKTITFRNHHSQHLQSPAPLLWHPSPQNHQGIKFQNSPPKCDLILTQRKYKTETSLSEYKAVGILLEMTYNCTASGPTTPQNKKPPPQNWIPQRHLSTFAPSQTNISMFYHKQIPSTVATALLRPVYNPIPANLTSQQWSILTKVN